VVLRGKNSVGWLKRCMSITIQRISDRNAGGKFGSWYTQVWCLIVVMRVDVKRMKIKQKYLLECVMVSALPVPRFSIYVKRLSRVLWVYGIDRRYRCSRR
jgi:hypothetical protein